jgi:hypothetical protein
MRRLRWAGILVALAIDGVVASTPFLPAWLLALTIGHACACVAYLIWTAQDLW